MSVTDAPELGVVLGGGIAADGSPSPSTRARAARAAQIAHEWPELALICAGDRPAGAPGGTPSEAALMRDAIVARGVAADRVDLEDESSDTVGSAVLVAVRYLRDRPPCPLHVITSPFHLERATETFRHVLGFAWQIQAVAADETEDDVLRAAAETVYLKETAALFAGLKPGDLRAIARRLRERSPEYARLDRLALS